MTPKEVRKLNDEEVSVEIERLRRKALKRFQIDNPKDLQQRSTFRFSGPDDR